MILGHFASLEFDVTARAGILCQVDISQYSCVWITARRLLVFKMTNDVWSLKNEDWKEAMVAPSRF